MTRLVAGPALDTLDPSQQKQLVERDYDSFYLNSLKVNDEMYEEQQKIFGDANEEISSKMKYRIEEQKRLMVKIEVPRKIVVEDKSSQAKGTTTGATDHHLQSNSNRDKLQSLMGNEFENITFKIEPPDILKNQKQKQSKKD